jgi:hypothetical protein
MTKLHNELSIVRSASLLKLYTNICFHSILRKHVTSWMLWHDNLLLPYCLVTVAEEKEDGCDDQRALY